VKRGGEEEEKDGQREAKRGDRGKRGGKEEEKEGNEERKKIRKKQGTRRGGVRGGTSVSTVVSYNPQQLRSCDSLTCVWRIPLVIVSYLYLPLVNHRRENKREITTF
jgi:hypothetical protein